MGRRDGEVCEGAFVDERRRADTRVKAGNRMGSGNMVQKGVGACFEIIVDGKPRSMRDRKEAAIEAGKYLKQKQPQSEVSVRDIRDNSSTMIDGAPIVALGLVAARKR
jgi:hypothetical protein